MVWKAIAPFDSIGRWHSDVVSCTLEDGGKFRRLTTRSGVQIFERLVRVDPEARVLAYSIIESPLPIRKHEATMTVRPEGNRSIVDWRCEFESAGPPDQELVPIFQQIFQTGLTSLKSHMETENLQRPA